MIFIADDCLFDPVVRSLQAVKFEIKWRKEVTSKNLDPTIMKACLDENCILITLDMGIPAQAYYYEYGQNGLTVIQLRWKKQTYREWQQMVEIILRESSNWQEIAQKDPSIISVNYSSGSRAKSWNKIPPLITQQVKEARPIGS